MAVTTLPDTPTGAGLSTSAHRHLPVVLAARGSPSKLHSLERLDPDPERHDGPHDPDEQADQDGGRQPEPKLRFRERDPSKFGVVLPREVEVAGHGQRGDDRAD